MSTTQQRAPHRIRRGALTTATTTALAVLVLTGCSPAAPSAGAKKTPASTAPSAAAAAKPAVATVPGYDVGQFPPVPLFRLPDLGLLSGSADAFAIEVDKSFADVPGVTVSPARCDAGGKVVSGAGSAMLYGDGSGNYAAPGLSIQNYGDGTAKVNGTTVKAAKLPAVARLGSFPPIAALAPVASCGTTITFQDGVLFDFDRADIRADAEKTIAAVAQVLIAQKVANAEISGHTDAIGDEADNQDLSERRARSVVAALQHAGAKTAMDPVGYGETRPVAPNEIDGQDDPAGRQLNRRVEIFIPAAV